MQYIVNMRESTERRTLNQVAKRLAELLEIRPSDTRLEFQPSKSRNGPRADAKMSAAGFKFVVEWKSSGTAAMISMAVRTVREFAENSREKLIPVVAAPYIGEVGKKLCDDANVCWLDLSGNAHLVAPRLRIIVDGKPNKFKRPGRPRSLFAPKSSRIARYLLMNPGKSLSQRALAEATGMDEGFTSRIVRKLEEQNLIVRDSTNSVQLADFDGLLNSWREAYDFSKHHVVRGHIATRSGEETLRKLADHLKREKIDWAATGLAGAWLLDRFAGFRLVTIYVTDLPSTLDKLGFREEQRGENVWLVVPNDEGVFQGVTKQEGICCVHPVQVYVDLKGHPERSAEAADELRKKLLTRGRDGH
ncbi:MAG: MarR family transcriptional regulator [Pirellulaceae bacterium]